MLESISSRRSPEECISPATSSLYNASGTTPIPKLEVVLLYIMPSADTAPKLLFSVSVAPTMSLVDSNVGFEDMSLYDGIKFSGL